MKKILLAGLALAALTPLAAQAHPFGQKPVAFIERDSSGVTFDWVIADDEVFVLANHLGLGPIRREALADAPAVATYLRDRVEIETAEGTCEMDDVVTGSPAVTGWLLGTRFECGAEPDAVTVTVRLLHDVSTDYVTLWQGVTLSGRARGAFTAARPAQQIVFTADGDALPVPGRGAVPSGLSARLIEAVQSGEALAPALLFALLLGAAHGLAPGHGKTLAAAVAAGSPSAGLAGAWRVAAAVTTTHMVSVGLLSAVATSAGSLLLPQTLAPALQIAAGIFALGLGTRMLMRAKAPHVHDHGEPEARRRALVAGVAGGIIPSPGAVAVTLVAFSAGHWQGGVAALAAFSAGLGSVVLAVALAASRGSQIVARSERLAASLPRFAGAAAMLAGVALIGSVLVR